MGSLKYNTYPLQVSDLKTELSSVCGLVGGGGGKGEGTRSGQP